MALSMRAVQTKIRSVANIKKITRAMEMVAAAKMQKASRRAEGARHYAREAGYLFRYLTRDQGLRHPLLRAGSGNRILYVLYGSYRGLCGNFNPLLVKRLQEENAVKEKRADFVTIGKHAERIARSLGGEIKGSFLELENVERSEEVGGVYHLIREEFRSKQYHRIVVVYHHFVSPIERVVKVRQVLPADPDDLKVIDQGVAVSEEQEPHFSRYVFEPREEAALESVLPRLVESELFIALLESLASEYSARMVAMKQATDNATELRKTLQLAYNKARQAAVTREVAEIVSGAEALTNT